jgi:outer membrane lipoprotein
LNCYLLRAIRLRLQFIIKSDKINLSIGIRYMSHKNIQYGEKKSFGFIGKLVSVLLLGAVLVGCAHIISKDMLKEVDSEIGFDELRKDPEKYQGKTVLLGGVIVKTENKNEGTLLEIYQTEINYYGEPIDIYISKGRFLAIHEQFLDGEIYRKGRKVTVVGVVHGVEVKKLGEIDYKYPYLIIKEIHLWKEKQPCESGPYYIKFWEPFYWEPWYRWYAPYWLYQYAPKSKNEEQDNTE